MLKHAGIGPDRSVSAYGSEKVLMRPLWPGEDALVSKHCGIGPEKSSDVVPALKHSGILHAGVGNFVLADASVRSSLKLLSFIIKTYM